MLLIKKRTNMRKNKYNLETLSKFMQNKEKYNNFRDLIEFAKLRVIEKDINKNLNKNNNSFDLEIDSL